MPEIFELIMVICFGISWPASIIKSLQAKTTKRKKYFFQWFIFIGYISGFIWKILSRSLTYVFLFYVIDFVMVSADISLYYRNSMLDKTKDLEELVTL